MLVCLARLGGRRHRGACAPPAAAADGEEVPAPVHERKGLQREEVEHDVRVARSRSAAPVWHRRLWHSHV